LGVTLRQKELVQTTWERVVPISEMDAGLFYGRLFEVNPELRALFPAGEGAMQEQGRKLMQTITIALNGMDRLDRITPAVHNLGRRHVAYGVRDGDYDTVGPAFLWTLEQGLGDDFTPKASEAWAETYGLIADVMKDAAGAAPQREGHGSAGPAPGTVN
jgi:hemoglobin-like flavoprotein